MFMRGTTEINYNTIHVIRIYCDILINNNPTIKVLLEMK